MISLSNLSDDRMRNAKTGQWWLENPQRALANNSAVYTEKPEMAMFIREWLSLYESRSGERGIFNRAAAAKQAAANNRRKWKDIEFGVNPCVEIILRSKGLCNLTEVVVRPGDTRDTLKEKVRKATILGTLQSTLTEFRYLRKEWQKNAEEERLLGVSLSGIMDNKLMSTNGPDLASLLDEFRLYAVKVNAKWAAKLGISPSVAVTCVKPSGTVSQLVNCSPGLHTRWAEWFSRAVREDRKNPIGAFLKACGVPNEPEASKPDDVDVFYFPMASPKGSITRDALTAIQQLELYLTYRQHWTEHNPSCTIYVKDHEWLDVAAWVFKHFDDIGGVAFLPHTNHIYKQAPYAEITEEEYKELAAKMPTIDWAKLSEYEKDDHTTAMKEIACSNGSCDL
jgi:ribonucleoside-diphosphate reductase alpha chain